MNHLDKKDKFFNMFAFDFTKINQMQTLIKHRREIAGKVIHSKLSNDELEMYEEYLTNINNTIKKFLAMD